MVDLLVLLRAPVGVRGRFPRSNATENTYKTSQHAATLMLSDDGHPPTLQPLASKKNKSNTWDQRLQLSLQCCSLPSGTPQVVIGECSAAEVGGLVTWKSSTSPSKSPVPVRDNRGGKHQPSNSSSFTASTTCQACQTALSASFVLDIWRSDWTKTTSSHAVPHQTRT